MLNGRGAGVDCLTDAVRRAWDGLSGTPRFTIHHAFAGRDAGLVGAAPFLLASDDGKEIL